MLERNSRYLHDLLLAEAVATRPLELQAAGFAEARMDAVMSH
jgi:hypothetical protein